MAFKTIEFYEEKKIRSQNGYRVKQCGRVQTMSIENGRSKKRELSSSNQSSQELVEMCVIRDIR